MGSRQRIVRRIVAVVLVVMLGAAVEVVSAGTVGASNPTSCTRTITGTSGPITVNSGELVCLYRAVVSGLGANTIRVNPGGGLIVSSSIIQDGGVNANQAFFLAVCASVLTSVFSTNGTGAVVLGWRAQGCGGNAIGTSRASGFVDLDNTQGGAVIFDGNRVGPPPNTEGVVIIDGSSGGVQVTQNTIYGSLDCQGNSPAPIGSGNTVFAGRFHQCASL